MAYFRNGRFSDDPWADRQILTAQEWLAGSRAGQAQALALQLEPGFEVETIGPDLEAFGLIKISFPKFTDGRGYSMGWLLRTRLGFKGEMRATGDVLFDEMQLMLRCGFDGFEIVDLATLKLLEEGRRASAFDRFYQPGLEPEVPAGTRPWARRSA